MSKLNETDGYNPRERVEQKIEQYKRGGVELTEEGAVEEIIADSMFRVFENEQYVHDLFEQHESLGEKIASRLKNFVQELKQLAKNLKSPEARAMAKQEAETVNTMVKLFNDAATMAMALRFNQMQETQEQNGQEGAQYQLKDSDGNIVQLTEQQIEDSKKTVANMDTVATITGNMFATGVKNDLVNDIDTYFTRIGRMARNKVLGDVQLNKSGAKHLVSKVATKRRRALIEAIKPVIEHGELVHIDNEHKGNNFDTAIIAAPVEMQEGKGLVKYYAGVVVKQSGAKNDNTYYFHDAVLADEKGGAVAFSTREGDLSEPRATTPSVASVLASIAKYNGQNGQNALSIKETMTEDNTGDTLTTDQAKYFANSQIRDNQGRLKVMYRGDSTVFNVFDRKKSKGSNLYGRGFYFTDSNSHAGQYGGTRAFYLDVQHALNAETAAREISKGQMRAYLEAVAENEDYGLENYGYDATIESVLNSLWGQSDFAMLQDINATAIGDFVAAIELFNDVNGTNYDGVVTPTETVIFKSEQAKLTSNKQPTASADIRYSLKEYTDSELENWKDSKNIEVYTDRVQGMNFINKALTDRNFRGKLYFGKIDTGLAAAIEEATGLDAEDYNLALHADEVRKITESHGNEASENLRGQAAITMNDLLDIPEVVKNATKITAGEYEGHDAIVFVREQGNRTTTVTYMVNKKHDLRVQTMYKSNKKRGLSTAYSVQAEHFTSETDPRYSPSDVNVAQENRNVKNQFSLKEDTGVLASLQGVDKINENMRQQIEDSEDFREVVRKLQKVMNSRGGIQEVQKKYVNSLAGELVEKWTPQGLSRKTLAENFK
ncbi:MAG: hypothetical protein Q4B32_11340 [Clostridia bacterium]|nr:hypothetical protein [Clostridia bacterium]